MIVLPAELTLIMHSGDVFCLKQIELLAIDMDITIIIWGSVNDYRMHITSTPSLILKRMHTRKVILQLLINQFYYWKHAFELVFRISIYKQIWDKSVTIIVVFSYVLLFLCDNKWSNHVAVLARSLCIFIQVVCLVQLPML